MPCCNGIDKTSQSRERKGETAADTTFINMGKDMQFLFLEMRGDRNPCVVVTFFPSYSG
jgi:hypothetical protein